MVLNRSTPSEIRTLYRLYSTTLDKEIADSERGSQDMARSHLFLPVVQRLKAGRSRVVTISNVKEKEDSEISIPQPVEELDILGSFVQSSRTLDVIGPYNDWARHCLAPIRAEAAFSILLAEKRTDDLVIYLMRLYDAKLVTDEGVQAMTDLLAVRENLLSFPVLEMPEKINSMHPASVDFTLPRYLADFELRPAHWKSLGNNWEKTYEDVVLYNKICRDTFDILLKTPS